MLKNLLKHSVDIVFNTIYVRVELTGTELDLVAEGCILLSWRLPLTYHCCNFSTVSKHQTFRIPSLLIQRVKGLPDPMKTETGKRVGKRKDKQRETASDKRYSTVQNSPTILSMLNSRESPSTYCFSQLKAAGAAAAHLPPFSCGNIQKAMQNFCDCSKVERVMKNQ